jgi:hypothetical protein
MKDSSDTKFEFSKDIFSFDINPEEIVNNLEGEVKVDVLPDPLDISKEGEVKVEDIKPVENTGESKNTEVITQGSKTQSAHQTAKFLIDKGLLEDLSIAIGEEEDEDAKPISERTDITSEQLEEIVQMYQSSRDEEHKNRFVDVSQIDETKKKIVNFLINGGDITEIASKPEQALRRPFEGLDMEEQASHEDIVYTYLTHAKGNTHDEAISLLEVKKNNGTLKPEAEQYYGAYQKAYDDRVTQVTEDRVKRETETESRIKTNRKALAEKLKEEGLKDNQTKKITEAFGRKNTKGEYEIIEKLREAIDSPAENYDLLVRLIDPEVAKALKVIEFGSKVARDIVRIAGSSGKTTKKVSDGRAELANSPWADILGEKI